MITLNFVQLIHDEILATEAGLHGNTNTDLLESCLGRVENRMAYEPLDDVFLIGAFYAMALAKAHAFSDGNKRTALVVMLTYLALNDIQIKANTGLDDLMVAIASSQIDFMDLSDELRRRVE